MCGEQLGRERGRWKQVRKDWGTCRFYLINNSRISAAPAPTMSHRKKVLLKVIILGDSGCGRPGSPLCGRRGDAALS